MPLLLRIVVEIVLLWLGMGLFLAASEGPKQGMWLFLGTGIVIMGLALLVAHVG